MPDEITPIVLLTLGNRRDRLARMRKTQFGRLVRAARTRQGLTLRELASRTGIDYSRLSRIEHGRRPAPQLSGIRRLADALSLEMSDLLVAAGTPREVVEQLLWSERLRTAGALSDLAAYRPEDSPLRRKNTFLVAVERRDGARTTVRLGEETLDVLSFSTSPRLRIEIPPEAIGVHRADPRGSLREGENVLPARIEKVRQMGALVNLVLAGRGFELNALRLRGRSPEGGWAVGDAVYIAVPGAAVRTAPEEEGIE